MSNGEFERGIWIRRSGFIRPIRHDTSICAGWDAANKFICGEIHGNLFLPPADLDYAVVTFLTADSSSKRSQTFQMAQDFIKHYGSYDTADLFQAVELEPLAWRTFLYDRGKILPFAGKYEQIRARSLLAASVLNLHSRKYAKTEKSESESEPKTGSETGVKETNAWYTTSANGWVSSKYYIVRDDEATVVDVVFKRPSGAYSKRYSYRCNYWPVNVGNRVIVDVPNSGYNIATVDHIYRWPETIPNASKWVVSIIDDSVYKQRNTAKALKRSNQVLFAEERKRLQSQLQKDLEELRKKFGLTEADTDADVDTDIDDEIPF